MKARSHRCNVIIQQGDLVVAFGVMSEPTAEAVAKDLNKMIEYERLVERERCKSIIEMMSCDHPDNVRRMIERIDGGVGL